MDDWLTPSQEGWIAMYALFADMRKAGFTRWEASLILVAMMQTGKEFPRDEP